MHLKDIKKHCEKSEKIVCNFRVKRKIITDDDDNETKINKFGVRLFQ